MTRNNLKNYKNKKNQKITLKKFQDISLFSYDQFLANSSFDRIQKILWKYELFKMVENVPGDIVECGVHKGSGIYLYAKLIKIFKPNSLSKVVGFDFFGKSQKIKNKHKIDYIGNQSHTDRGSKPKEIIKNLKKYGIHNVKLIPGDVCATTKNYVKKNLGFRISMLVLDVDNYEGTLECLKNLYQNVTRGGIIVLDEYALETFGESDAVDEFLKDKKIKVKSVPWSATPTAYFIKE